MCQFKYALTYSYIQDTFFQKILIALGLYLTYCYRVLLRQSSPFSHAPRTSSNPVVASGPMSPTLRTLCSCHKLNLAGGAGINLADYGTPAHSTMSGTYRFLINICWANYALMTMHISYICVWGSVYSKLNNQGGPLKHKWDHVLCEQNSPSASHLIQSKHSSPCSGLQAPARPSSREPSGSIS